MGPPKFHWQEANWENFVTVNMVAFYRRRKDDSEGRAQSPEDGAKNPDSSRTES